MSKPVYPQTSPKQARGMETRSPQEYPKSKEVLEAQNNPMNVNADTMIPYGG